MASRVRRKRQRLSPDFLVEKHLVSRSHSQAKVCLEAFPIKAGGNPETGKKRGRETTGLRARGAGTTMFDNLSVLSRQYLN